MIPILGITNHHHLLHTKTVHPVLEVVRSFPTLIGTCDTGSFLILDNLRQIGDENLTKGDTHQNHETVDLNKVLFNRICHELELFVDLVKMTFDSWFRRLLAQTESRSLQSTFH